MRYGRLAAPVIWRLRSSIHTVYPNSVIRRNRLVAIASLAAPVAGGGVTSLAALPGRTRGPASESSLDCGADVPGTARFGGAGHGHAAGERRAQSSRPDLDRDETRGSPTIRNAHPSGPGGSDRPGAGAAAGRPTGWAGAVDGARTERPDAAHRPTRARPNSRRRSGARDADRTASGPADGPGRSTEVRCELGGSAGRGASDAGPAAADAGSGFPSRCLSPSRRRSPCRAPDGRHDEEPRDGLSAPAVAQAGRPQTEE